MRNASRADSSTIDQSKSHNDTRNSRTPLAPKPVNQASNTKPPTKVGNLDFDGLRFSELKDEYMRLTEKYTKLRVKYVELEDAQVEVNQRLREKTKVYNQWKDHASQLNELCAKRCRKIKTLEARLAAAVAAASPPFDASFSFDASVQPLSRQEVAVSDFVAPDARGKPGLARLGHIARETRPVESPIHIGGSSREPPRSVASPKPTKSDSEPRISQRRDITPGSETHASTEDGDIPSLPPLPQNRDSNPGEVPIKAEPSSDSPIIMSERCLRKRKRGDDQKKGVPLSTIKREDGSSPFMIDQQHHFEPHESMDFDAEGPRVHTPRKRNRESVQPRDVALSNSAEASPLQSNSILLARQDGHPMEGRTKRGYSPTRPTLDEIPESIQPRERAIKPLKARADESSVLKPLDRNAVVQRRPEGQKGKGPSFRWTGLDSLAEDDDQHGASNTPTQKRSKTGRLRNLLNTPSLEHEAIDLPLVAQSNSKSTSVFTGIEVPPRRKSPFGKGSAKKVSKIPQSLETPVSLKDKRTPKNVSTKRVSDGVSHVGGDARPLRERPMSELGLADFKINTDANEGYDYAFTDVVRNKDERANLAGCVKEDCCGPMFRLNARARRDQTSASDFQALLERHLGDDAWKLSSMSKTKKEEMWLEAKMQELADEQGKHRHRFHRQASPPGYWRVDFPSTQEEQRDKEEGAKRTRQVVEERYREAMRPGGRWVFRDE